MIDKKLTFMIGIIFLISMIPIGVHAELKESAITHEEIMDGMSFSSKIKYAWAKNFGISSSFSALGKSLNCETQPSNVFTFTVDYEGYEQTVVCGDNSLIDLYKADNYYFLKEVWSPHTFSFTNVVVGSRYIIECYSCPTDTTSVDDDTPGATVPASDTTPTTDTPPTTDTSITGDKGLYILSINALPAVGSNVEVQVEVKMKNDANVAQTGNVEVGIYADKVATDWGLMSIFSGVEPIQTCGGEIFSTAKRITVAPGVEDTFIFTILSPNKESVLTDGTSNWDSSHAIVAGIYDECGAGYKTTLDKYGTDNGAWELRNIKVEESELTDETPSNNLGIYISKLTTEYDAKQDNTVTYKLTLKNDLSIAQSTKAEVGIYADTIVRSWGMLSVLSSAEPIQSCQDEPFVAAKEITMEGNSIATYEFTIDVPNLESTLSDGTSNWGSSHTVVAGLYKECGGGYQTSNGKFGTSNGAWEIKNLQIGGGYDAKTLLFIISGVIIFAMLAWFSFAPKKKK